MKVAIVQLSYGDDESVPERTARVADLVRAQRGHDLVVLPELWSAGGFDYRAWPEREQRVDGEVTQALAQVARDLGCVLHTGSLMERPGDEPGPEGRGLWNTSVVLGPDGEVCATYRKVHRFGFGQGEPRLLEAGTETVVLDLPAPADDLTVGLSTCYDLRFPELYRAQLDLGAQAFVVPAAWPLARVEHWRVLLRARAIEDQCFVIACTTAGTHAHTPMGGRSAVVDPTGEVLAEAGEDEEVLSVDLDPAVVTSWRERFPVMADRRL
jgi:predicted amidohydrolase